MSILYVGIDLAKNASPCVASDVDGKAEMLNPSVARSRLQEVFAACPPSTIGMEACSGFLHSKGRLGAA